MTVQQRWVKVLQTFCVHWEEIGSDQWPSNDDLSSSSEEGQKQTRPRLRFDLEKFREPDGTCTVFAQLISLRYEDMDAAVTITQPFTVYSLTEV